MCLRSLSVWRSTFALAVHWALVGSESNSLLVFLKDMTHRSCFSTFIMVIYIAQIDLVRWSHCARIWIPTEFAPDPLDESDSANWMNTCGSPLRPVRGLRFKCH